MLRTKRYMSMEKEGPRSFEASQQILHRRAQTKYARTQDPLVREEPSQSLASLTRTSNHESHLGDSARMDTDKVAL